MLKRIFQVVLTLFLFCNLLRALENFPFTGLITQDNINVRSGANINFEPLCKLSLNEKVTVVGKSYSWYKIVLPKEAACFISDRYLKVEDSNGLVTGNRVNIRAKPSEGASILAQVNKGDSVKVIKKFGQWYAIEPRENCFGWVHENFVKFYSDKPIATAQIEPPEKKELITDSAAIENTISAVGIIKPMGRFFNRQGTHKLLSDGKIVYLLSGDKNKLDSFINYRVKVVGEKKNISSKYPVITVKQITYLE